MHNIKFIIQEFLANVGSTVQPYGSFLDISTNATLSNFFFNFDYSPYDDRPSMVTAINAAIVAQAAVMGYTPFAAADVIWLTGMTEQLPAVGRVVSYPSRAYSTAYQPSATRDARITVSTTLVAAFTLAAAAVGYDAIEVADDSAFTTNVIEAARIPHGINAGLVVALGVPLVGGGSASFYVPAGKYYRVRGVNTTGTLTRTLNSTQQVLEA